MRNVPRQSEGRKPRRRVYTLYARARSGPFTVYSEAYGRGTHPYLYEVYATTVRQAYALACREVWAVDAHGLGVRRIYGFGVSTLAPYLEHELTGAA